MQRFENYTLHLTQEQYNDLAEKDPACTYIVDGVVTLTPEGASAVRGSMPLSTGQWANVPSISRLRVVGTGALSIDSRNRAGAVASAVFTGTYSATPETIEFPYYGDSAVQIRATFPATLTVEVI